ncbi:MAG: glycosyltransferase family 2 protein [Methanomassiliicoccus sp.]|nr:glycosyltransferase family 2 protein [Methanomassiliicoccus sp.]
MSNEVAIIIPAYNEELTIGSVVLRARRFADTVIVADDGSTDRTSEVASLAGAKVIRSGVNRGKADAIMRGFAELEGAEYTVAVMLDADGQHYPEDLPDVIAPILSDEADLVIGSRFMDGSSMVPAYRRLGQKLLDRFTNIGAAKTIGDTQSGFRAMGRKGVQNMDFRSTGYSLESAMIMHFVSRGLRIEEVPIRVSYDVPNKHKKNPISMGVEIVNHLIIEAGHRRPLMLFGLPGAVLGTMGIVLGTASLVGAYPFGWSWAFQMSMVQTLVVLGAMMTIAGLGLSSVSHIIRGQAVVEPVKVKELDAKMELVQVETIRR